MSPNAIRSQYIRLTVKIDGLHATLKAGGLDAEYEGATRSALEFAYSEVDGLLREPAAEAMDWEVWGELEAIARA